MYLLQTFTLSTFCYHCLYLCSWEKTQHLIQIYHLHKCISDSFTMYIIKISIFQMQNNFKTWKTMKLVSRTKVRVLLGKKKKFPTVRTCKRFCDVRKASASLQQRKGVFNKKKPNQMKLNGWDWWNLTFNTFWARSLQRRIKCLYMKVCKWTIKDEQASFIRSFIPCRVK